MHAGVQCVYAYPPHMPNWLLRAPPLPRYQCAALREVCLAYVAAHFPEVEGDVAALEPALQAEVRLRLDWA